MRNIFFLLATATCIAGEVRITLPAEKGAFRAGAGAELAAGNCLICHSVEYISSQPPMARKFWEASVQKMREKYGAPVPDDAVVKLVNYLALAYGAPVAK